ncbi:bifunctional adenosylcobinamide kinase/adenosylcobinamide-phosphate guanylyltransferase [Flavobacterium sp. HSC-61S13]|uniref:bifunctional adenosylcobinamide kinase/adenosylcobinamide-phosphate guanylyltransferase n=1 Tax=Flavobacterium sp. HSC-61S13 TaxID=2910963 RepID=UPI00209FD2C7|nr:bifunctional adenosylcobinamide kinase/adenosylcobinamide-phosphate guanylyltransferase [Flavobacterium sp. HSC-61S13]MCP1997273.1 adenosyl cobinamide kinase/adenosyl cobinamide phosphate guanylyltransferase [Flavobacterium sp. HSC-61S13]
MKRKRALTVANILATKIERIVFKGRFYDVFDHPQKKGRWLVWGLSSSGKSSFVMQLAKEFSETEKTLLVTLEEAVDDENLQDRLRLFQMQDVKKNFSIVDDNLEELSERLRKRNSPQVVVIDSAVYFFLEYTFSDYLKFTREFKNKTIIFTAHANGQWPKSELEMKIMYDATQKVLVSGYLATNKGRKYGPHSTQYVVWQKGYEDLHGRKKDNQDENTPTP